MPAHPDAVSVRGGAHLSGTVRTPGDKSISHRAVLIAALADGESIVRGASDGDDVARTAAAVEMFGATVTRRAGTLTIAGGRDALHAPAHAIDCGNSGTSLRLLAGVAASFPWTTRLFGDASLSTRPMDRIAVPLSAMGAIVQGRGTAILPPIVVGGGGLSGIEWTPPMASAQVKSCILLAGLHAAGETVVREPVATRAHTEEMLAQAGADIVVEPWGDGRSVRVRRSRLHPLDIDVPGDPSQAAFWLVAACVTPASSVAVEHVYAGRDRIGYVSVLERMGASIVLDGGPDGTSNMSARHSALQGTEIDAAEIPSLDEVPILAVAAVAARGTTTFRNVGELAVKESDRLAGTIALVEALGGRAWSERNVLVVDGAGAIGPGPVRFDSGGDHRLAMAGIVGALASPAGGMLRGVRSVQTSYRGFLDDLWSLAGPGAWSPADEAE